MVISQKDVAFWSIEPARRKGYQDGSEEVVGEGPQFPLAPPGRLDLGQRCRLSYWPELFHLDYQNLVQDLMEEVHWETREVWVKGRYVPQPRLVAYVADDPSLAYTYSGMTAEVQPFGHLVGGLRDQVEEVTRARYNSCLLNWYRDGSDSISWHADDEILYGQCPTIASVSFGVRRDFLLRWCCDPTRGLRYCLGGGDLLVMEGYTQQYWQHAVPKARGLTGSRLNLTFRLVTHPQGPQRSKRRDQHWKG